MDNLQKERIVIKRKETKEDIAVYRDQQLAKLYSFCVDNGGHCFDKWRPNALFESFGNDGENRMCKFCHYVEERQIS